MSDKKEPQDDCSQINEAQPGCKITAEPEDEIDIPYPEPCKLCIECDGSCY